MTYVTYLETFFSKLKNAWRGFGKIMLAPILLIRNINYPIILIDIHRNDMLNYHVSIYNSSLFS